MPMRALVLTAGGARGAYQAGVLKRIGEIHAFQGKPSPFRIITGASAGAINGIALATGTENFSAITTFLADLWSRLKMENIFRTDIGSLGSLMGQLAKDLSLGSLIGGGRAQSLLDATPMRAFLGEHIRFERIQAGIDGGTLFAVGITATNYVSGKSFTFIQGKTGHKTWEKSRRLAIAAKLNIDHICASAAIPIVFQPVLIKTPIGDFYFGDGGLRLVTPISPAIRLGAESIFAIGVRSQKSAEERSRAELLSFTSARPVMRHPPLAQVMGVILNSIFLDHLDSDLEHLKRINEIINAYSVSQENSGKLKEPIRPVEPFSIGPSIDLAKIAEFHASKMPPVVRYIMEGLGSSKSESADLMSYVLFDRAYTQTLIDLGYRDAHERIDEIEQFLRVDAKKMAA